MKYFDFKETANAIAKHSEDPAAIVNARKIAANQEFPGAVNRAGFRLLKPGGAIDLRDIPEAVLIGVELWSDQDLIGLDSLANRMRGKSISVFVFDLDEWSNSGELDRVLPGIRPRRTPVVVHYRYGRMVEALEGSRALARINQLA